MRSYATARLQLRAVIGEHTFDDVIQFGSTFALNSIPSAAISVAVGANAATGTAAKIHTVIRDLQNQLPAQVFLLVTPLDSFNADIGLPVQEFKIFEGYAVGTGWQRTPSGAHFTIHLLHWLADLNYASAVSASTHPGSPAALAYPAVFATLGSPTRTPQAGSTAKETAWTPQTSTELLGATAIDDIWGEVLHPWIADIAESDPIDAVMSIGLPAGGSPDIRAAIARMAANLPSVLADGKPLAIDTLGANGTLLAEGIRQALLSESGGNWVNTTLWGKIIGEWAPAYWFAVCPRVEDALVVPFAGGLQGDPWAVIGGDDYVSCELNASMPQVLRGVGILHSAMYVTGADLGATKAPIDAGGLAGWYSPPGVEKGLILFKDCPKWLAVADFAQLRSFTAEGIGEQPIKTALDPKGAGAPANPAQNPAATQVFDDVTTLYAKQWYTLEALKGRVGELAGKLRFDIAPGSNIKVEAAGERNSNAVPPLQEDMFATVTQVACVINAESRQAGTAFTLAHIRTGAENRADATSTAKPALYLEAWPGAALLTGDAFKPPRV